MNQGLCARGIPTVHLQDYAVKQMRDRGQVRLQLSNSMSPKCLNIIIFVKLNTCL